MNKIMAAELQQAKAAAERASGPERILASIRDRNPDHAGLRGPGLQGLARDQDIYELTYRRAGDNLLHLINDILDLSKVEASQLELERTGFSLNDHLEKVTEMVADRAREKGLALVCEIAPNVPADLVGDRHGCGRCCLICLGTRSSSRNPAKMCPRFPADGDSVTALRDGHRTPWQIGYLFDRHRQHRAQVRGLGARAHDFEAPGGTDGRAHLGRKRSRGGQRVFFCRAI